MALVECWDSEISFEIRDFDLPDKEYLQKIADKFDVIGTLQGATVEEEAAHILNTLARSALERNSSAKEMHEHFRTVARTWILGPSDHAGDLERWFQNRSQDAETRVAIHMHPTIFVKYGRQRFRSSPWSTAYTMTSKYLNWNRASNVSNESRVQARIVLTDLAQTYHSSPQDVCKQILNLSHPVWS